MGEKALDDTPIIVIAVIVCIFCFAFVGVICYVKCNEDKEKEEKLK